MIVIVGVLVLDVVSVVNASLGVRQNATDAADQALTTYIQTESPAWRCTSASTFLKLHGSVTAEGRQQPCAFEPRVPSRRRVTITAASTPHTYVFHYFQALPLGHRALVPQVLQPAARPRQTTSRRRGRGRRSRASGCRARAHHQSSSSAAGGLERALEKAAHLDAHQQIHEGVDLLHLVHRLAE